QQLDQRQHGLSEVRFVRERVADALLALFVRAQLEQLGVHRLHAQQDARRQRFVFGGQPIDRAELVGHALARFFLLRRANFVEHQFVGLDRDLFRLVEHRRWFFGLGDGRRRRGGGRFGRGCRLRLQRGRRPRYRRLLAVLVLVVVLGSTRRRGVARARTRGFLARGAATQQRCG